MLTGSEVKSVRNGRTNLRDGFVRIDGNEAWLENVNISPYTQANLMNHEPMRRASCCCIARRSRASSARCGRRDTR